MNKKEKAAIVKGWEIQQEIIRDITALAQMNEPLAYGAIRTAETIIDMILVHRLDKAQKDIEQEQPK